MTFKKGCIPWNKGTKGICKPNSSSFKRGKHSSPKTEFKKGVIPWIKGKRFTYEKMYGEERAKEIRNKKAKKAKPNSGSFKKGFRYTGKIEEKRIRNVLRKLIERPTSFEKRLKEILDKIQPNQWKYTGDGSFLIGYKNPDFVNVNGKKICIEVYHDYFKIKDFGSCENYEKQRSKHFAKYGWKTIFITENNLNDIYCINKKLEVI